MPIPQRGDILIRAWANGSYSLLDAISWGHIAGPFNDFAAAVTEARIRGVRAVWQQDLDGQGQPLGDPFRLPDI